MHRISFLFISIILMLLLGCKNTDARIDDIVDSSISMTEQGLIRQDENEYDYDNVSIDNDIELGIMLIEAQEENVWKITIPSKRYDNTDVIYHFDVYLTLSNEWEAVNNIAGMEALYFPAGFVADNEIMLNLISIIDHTLSQQWNNYEDKLEKIMYGYPPYKETHINNTITFTRIYANQREWLIRYAYNDIDEGTYICNIHTVIEEVYELSFMLNITYMNPFETQTEEYIYQILDSIRIEKLD